MNSSISKVGFVATTLQAPSDRTHMHARLRAHARSVLCVTGTMQRAGVATKTGDAQPVGAGSGGCAPSSGDVAAKTEPAVTQVPLEARREWGASVLADDHANHVEWSAKKDIESFTDLDTLKRALDDAHVCTSVAVTPCEVFHRLNCRFAENRYLLQLVLDRRFHSPPVYCEALLLLQTDAGISRAGTADLGYPKAGATVQFDSLGAAVSHARRVSLLRPEPPTPSARLDAAPEVAPAPLSSAALATMLAPWNGFTTTHDRDRSSPEVVPEIVAGTALAPHAQ